MARVRLCYRAQGPGYEATSTSTITFATGNISLVTQEDLAYTDGARIRITDASDITKYMEGVVTSYDSSTGDLSVAVDKNTGSGSNSDWNINLSGDTGATGPTGPQGPVGMTWEGSYNAGTTYQVDDVVSYNGSSYICILESTGNLPTDTTYWSVLAQKGTDGAGGDVFGPATNTDGYIPQWNGANSKTLKDGLAVPAGGLAGLTALGLKQNQLNGTGFVKASGTTISYDDSTYLTSSNIEDSIVDGHTTIAPSGNAVFDALSLKAPLASPTFTGKITTPAIDVTASDATGNLATITNTDATNYSRIKYVGTVNSFSSGVGNGSATITDLVNKFYIYDFTNAKVAMTIVPNTLKAKLYGDVETVGNIELGNISDTTISRASAGVIAVEGKNVAIDGQVNARRIVELQIVAIATDVDTTSGIGYFNVPYAFNGMNLVRAQAYCDTAGTTNATTVQVRNMTKYASNDALSSAISIASGGTVGTAGTVDTSYDDVATDDLLKIYVTGSSSTKCKGLRVCLEYSL